MLKFRYLSPRVLSVRHFSREVFRQQGYKYARISPFRRFYEQHPTLMAEGQRVFELEKEFPIKPDAMETQEYSTLSKMYLDKVAPEFEHVESASEREWLYEEYEREIGATLSRSQQA